MSIRRLFLFTMAYALLRTFGFGPTLVRADEKMYENALPSTVWVLSTAKDTIGLGTGVLIDARKRLVLTAYHVVESRADALLFFPVREKGQLLNSPKHYLDNEKTVGFQGKVIATDAIHDLALIQLPKIPIGATPIRLASGSVKPGQSVFAIGNSGASNGVLWKYIPGSVSQVYMKKLLYETKQEVKANMVEMTSPVNQGDSGGPLLNAEGELVGIVAAWKQNANAVHYAIDINEIRTMVASHLSPEPTATVGLRIEHNVARDKREGLLVHCKLRIKNGKEVPCKLAIDLCDSKGDTLIVPARTASEQSQKLLVNVDVQPRFDDSEYDDVSWFVPYESIQKSMPISPASLFEPAQVERSDRKSVRCIVNVKENGSKRWMLPGSKLSTFDFNPVKGVPLLKETNLFPR